MCFLQGLGKTIISLATILVNPAPGLPESGSPIAALNTLNNSGRATWDKDMYARTQAEDDANPKRGSLISRGTLVICHVSLVGQWIEEAKSKLTDPGLVYPYHGQSRKRDPTILCKNAIVVVRHLCLSDFVFI